MAVEVGGAEEVITRVSPSPPVSHADVQISFSRPKLYLSSKECCFSEPSSGLVSGVVVMQDNTDTHHLLTAISVCWSRQTPSSIMTEFVILTAFRQLSHSHENIGKHVDISHIFIFSLWRLISFIY